MSVLIGADLHGIDDPEGIASVLEQDLQDATVKALKRLAVVGLATYGGHGQ